MEVVFVLELLKEDLDLLAVGGALGQQVEALFNELQLVFINILESKVIK